MAAGLLWLLAAFVAGSIPFGFLAGCARGVDIRKQGSGNIGATNAGRVLGRPWGIAVLALDILKGAFAAGVLGSLAGAAWPPIPEPKVIAGVLAVLGHNYCPWLGWKGGKGIACTGGALAAALPLGFFPAVGAWIVVALASRMVSAGSIAAGVALAASGVAFYGASVGGAACVVMGIMGILRHRANIRRILAGTEPRIFAKKRAEAGTESGAAAGAEDEANKGAA